MRKRTRIGILLCLMAMLACSFGLTVYADTTDVLWTYNCNTWGMDTLYRDKSNDSWVYCHPMSGTTTKARAYGADNTSGLNRERCSEVVEIQVGKKGFIWNWVNEHGHGYASLRFRPETASNVTNWGYWSSDSVWVPDGVEYGAP